MDRKKIRRDLATGLQRPVGPELWKLLIKQGWVDDVVRGAREISELVGIAQDILRAGAERPEPQSKERREGGTEAWARSVLVADIARRDPDVIAYRREVLEHRLLSQDEVVEWVERQEKEEVPIRWASLAVEESSTYPDGTIRGRPVGWSARVLKYAGPDDEWVRLASTGRGALERLRKLSESLAKFYAWTEAQAVVFVLTDVLPWIAPVRVTSPAMKIRYEQACPWAQRITLDVDPSVSPSELARVYQSVRNKNGRRRRLSQKHARLAIFKTDHPNLSWSELLRRWNKEEKRWKYNHLSNFRRDALRAQQHAIGALDPLADSW